MENRIRHIAIVLAAGRGSRMNSAVPKQYMLLLGRPVLYYSVKRMQESFIDDIILICQPGEECCCREQIVERYRFDKVRAVAAGGKERYDSVLNGLAQAGRLGLGTEQSYVYIHDGARPCIDAEVLAECRENVMRYNACVPAVPVKDTIKVADGDGFCKDTPDRAFLAAVQTPQCFRYDLAWRAYSSMAEDFRQGKAVGNITDDAMVVQRYAGVKVKLCTGSFYNIKITTPEDMETAESILRRDGKIKEKSSPQ